MPAQIIQFPIPPTGNGAREVVKDYLERIHVARTLARCVADPVDVAAALPDEDYFLAWLWSEGFKIVPLDDSD